jgi:twitching motility protein PilT
VNEIKNLISHLLEYATKEGADLHICPKSAPFARLTGKNGKLQPVPGYDDWQLDLATVKAFINELLTPEQKSELLKNKFLDFSLTYGELGRFRACVYTQRGTHAMTIHTLPFDVPDLYELGLFDDVIDKIEDIITEPNGLIVVAVNYFSSASYLLAALVDLANERRNCHISTIERPIEYLHKHKKSIVTQKEIGADAPDFGAALRQVRCENADVCMISELRHEDLFSVMELAEERLVLTGLKLNAQLSNAEEIITVLRDLTRTQAPIFTPNPKITLIKQQDDEIIVFDSP